MEQEVKSVNYIPTFGALMESVNETICQMNKDGFILTSISHNYEPIVNRYNAIMVFTKE